MQKKFVQFIKKNLTILILFSIILRLMVLFITPAIGDIINAYKSGEQFLKTGVVYGEVLYPYPPPVIWYNAFTLYISQMSNLPFLYVNKLLAVFSDITTIYILYRTLKKKWHVLLYAYNPVTILISSSFGKEEPYVIFLALLSYLFFLKSRKNVSSVLLGISIGIKIFTILLLPLFLKRIHTIREKIVFIILAIAPLIILMIPIQLTNSKEIMLHMGGYAGVADYGWLAVIKSLSSIIAGTSINFSPINGSLSFLLSINKSIFVITYTVLIFWLMKVKKSLLEEIILVFLLFYIMYGGTGTNYLYWVITFLVFYSIKYAFYYSVFSAFAIFGYIASQFYEPVLKYTSFFLFKTPLFVNLLYFAGLTILYLYLVFLFFQVSHKGNLNKINTL